MRVLSPQIPDRDTSDEDLTIDAVERATVKEVITTVRDHAHLPAKCRRVVGESMGYEHRRIEHEGRSIEHVGHRDIHRCAEFGMNSSLQQGLIGYSIGFGHPQARIHKVARMMPKQIVSPRPRSSEPLIVSPGNREESNDLRDGVFTGCKEVPHVSDAVEGPHRMKCKETSTCRISEFDQFPSIRTAHGYRNLEEYVFSGQECPPSLLGV